MTHHLHYQDSSSPSVQSQPAWLAPQASGPSPAEQALDAGCRSPVAGTSRAAGCSAGSLPCATVPGLAAAVCFTGAGQGCEGAEAAGSPGQHSSCKLCCGTSSCHQATCGCRQCCRCSTRERLADEGPLCSVQTAAGMTVDLSCLPTRPGMVGLRHVLCSILHFGFCPDPQHVVPPQVSCCDTHLTLQVQGHHPGQEPAPDLPRGLAQMPQQPCMPLQGRQQL